MTWTGPRVLDPRCAALLLVVWAGCARPAPKVQEGDIIFQMSRSSQSDAIRRATGSRYSHMGLVFIRDGQPFVLEAVATVRYTPLGEWIARGQGRHYAVRRTRRPLSPDQIAGIRSAAAYLEGKPYDAAFEWSDQRIYCSELVWKSYERGAGLPLGRLQHLKDFKLDDPVVRSTLRERYGNHIPFDETVISPKAIFDSRLLIGVETR